jgi:hypothetical protein
VVCHDQWYSSSNTSTGCIAGAVSGISNVMGSVGEEINKGTKGDPRSDQGSSDPTCVGEDQFQRHV